MKILIFATHPDDEILGVGGTICLHKRKEDEIFICVATRPYQPEWSSGYIKEKNKAQKEVDQFLGIERRFFLNLPTVKLNTVPHGELNKKITDVMRRVNPDVVYAPHGGDLNYDHSLVFRSTLVASRPPNKARLLCYETLSETEWGVEQFNPNIWHDISDVIEKKIEAFKIYKTEMKEYPHPRSPEGIRILAQKRGSEICTKYAEAFKLIREIK